MAGLPGSAFLVAGRADAPPVVVSVEGEAAGGMRLAGRRWAWAPVIASNSSKKASRQLRSKTGIFRVEK
jgi:hypothetical protein